MEKKQTCNFYVKVVTTELSLFVFLDRWVLHNRFLHICHLLNYPSRIPQNDLFLQSSYNSVCSFKRNLLFIVVFILFVDSLRLMRFGYPFDIFAFVYLFRYNKNGYEKPKFSSNFSLLGPQIPDKNQSAGMKNKPDLYNSIKYQSDQTGQHSESVL